MTAPVRLFIGYNSYDSAVVDTAVTRLRMLRQDNGMPLYALWHDKTSIPAGTNWWAAALDGIIGSQAGVFFISRGFLQSEVCLAELKYALACNRVVIPVLIEDTPTIWQEMPDYLSSLAADFIVYDERKFFDALEDSIGANWSGMHETGFAPRPYEPGATTTPDFYGQALAAAANEAYDEAETLLRKVIGLNTDDANNAYEWMHIVHRYKELVELDSRASTRFRVASRWSEYVAAFPFDTLFDPRGFAARFS